MANAGEIGVLYGQHAEDGKKQHIAGVLFIFPDGKNILPVTDEVDEQEQTAG